METTLRQGPVLLSEYEQNDKEQIEQTLTLILMRRYKYIWARDFPLLKAMGANTIRSSSSCFSFPRAFFPAPSLGCINGPFLSAFRSLVACYVPCYAQAVWMEQ